MFRSFYKRDIERIEVDAQLQERLRTQLFVVVRQKSHWTQRLGLHLSQRVLYPSLTGVAVMIVAVVLFVPTHTADANAPMKQSMQLIARIVFEPRLLINNGVLVRHVPQFVLLAVKRTEPTSTFSELPASELPQRTRSTKILTAVSESNEQTCQLVHLTRSDQFICVDAARQAHLDIGQTLILSR